MEHNLKSIKQEFKSKGIFYTPPELAKLIKSYVDRDVVEVYDPTCGDGGLLSVFPDNAKKYGQELDGEQLRVAEDRLVNFHGVCGDTLTNPAFLGKKFECIVANPPFSVKWTPPAENGIFTDARFREAPTIPSKGRADYAFLLHIIHYLANDGIAVTLNFPGVLYRGNREGQIREWMIKKNYIQQVISIPPKTFVDTPIATAIIIFKKNKATTDIIFTDQENDITRTVKREEVASNDYNLSVSSYCQVEEEKEEIDPNELEESARKNMIDKLRRDIEFSKMVCEFENVDFKSYIKDIQDLINEYK